jgi:hypothetical protein
MSRTAPAQAATTLRTQPETRLSGAMLSLVVEF